MVELVLIRKAWKQKRTTASTRNTKTTKSVAQFKAMISSFVSKPYSSLSESELAMAVMQRTICTHRVASVNRSILTNEM